MVEDAIGALLTRIGTIKQHVTDAGSASAAKAKKTADDQALIDKNAAVVEAKKVAEEKALADKNAAVVEANAAAALVIESLVDRVAGLDTAVTEALRPPAPEATPVHEAPVPVPGLVLVEAVRKSS